MVCSWGFICRANEIDIPVLHTMTEQQLDVFSKMAIRKINATSTTSMGRLFDGISALMGICTHIEFEAQAAVEMEALLQRDFSLARPFEYDITPQDDGGLEVDYRPIVRDIVRALSTPNVDIPKLSRRFHSTSVDMICEVSARLAAQTGTSQLVMSGGVFCNEYILTSALTALELRGLKPFCHQLVPTNDGGISLGQAVIAAHSSAVSHN